MPYIEKLIDTSSASFGTGLSCQRKLFKIKTGQYTGRLIAIYPKTSPTIVFSWSDPPYTTWSAPTTIVADSADYPVSAWMDNSHNLYLTYTAATSLALNMIKLTYSSGTWAVGTAQSIYTSDQNYYPFIFKDKINRLWVVWSRYIAASSDYRLQVKVSTNDGGTWGTGITDPGTQLSSAASSAYGQLIASGDNLYCFYTVGGSVLNYRYYEIYGTLWSSEFAVWSGSGLASDFNIALSSDQKIGIAYATSPPAAGLFFKEFDGNLFSGQLTVDTNLVAAPQVLYIENTPYVIYTRNIGTEQNQVFYAYRSGTSFSPPATLFIEDSPFSKVFCYDHSAQTKYYDRTNEAASSAPGDIYHPTSGGLVKDPPDALLVGADHQFNQIKAVLATTGIAGQVNFSYWNGSEWLEFVPDSGSYHFTFTPVTIRLWPDLSSIPSDWQKSAVNGQVKFWVKVEAQSAFTTAPTGSQITAVPNTADLSIGV